MRLLLVEDEPELTRRLQKALKQAGYAVDIATDGVEGQYLGEVEPYDAVVLDLGLPERPGLEVLANWRAGGIATPVLILTARDAWHERVDGFRAGADDYLGKPFHVEELLARLQALIRRSRGASGPLLEVSDLRLDEERQRVIHPLKGEIELTGTEFRLLRYFMLHPDRVLSKHRLTEHVYEGDFDRDSNLIEVYVRRLRDKLDRRYIETLRGQGYRFPGTPR